MMVIEKNKFFIMLGCLFTFMSCGSVAYAELLIANIVGNVSHNQKVSINGTGFGPKSPAAPIIWANFENGSVDPTPLGQLHSWSDYSSALVANGTNNLPNSNYNVVGEWNSANSQRSFSFRVDKTYWSKIYHYQKRFFDFTITGNQKYWRLWPTSGSNDFVSLWHGPSSGMCYNESEGYIGGSIGGYQGTAPSINNWHIEEFIWQFEGGSGLNQDGTPGSGATGIWDYTVDGVQNQHRENVDNGANNQVQLRTDNFTDSNYLSPDGSKVFMDDIYIDDTYARVMLGNASTLSASIHREIQIPTTWNSDGSHIEIVVNAGSFQNGDSAYLYVIDADGNVSNNGQGFEITIGEGGNNAPADNTPALTFTAPTTESTYTAEATSEASQEVTITGTANDDNTVQSVTYATDKGDSGSASSTDGFATWSVPVTVNKNETVVTTVTVTDDAGQSTSKTMTITCTCPVGWDATLQTGDSIWTDSGVTYCVRLLVKGDSVAGSAGQVVLGFQGRSSGEYTIRNVSIAQRDTAGSEGDVMDSTWKQVTFGNAAWGSNVTVGAGTEKLSDPVRLNLAPGTDYYVTFKIDSPSVYLDPPTGYRELYFDSADHTSDVDWGGNGHSVTQDYHALSKIYIYDPATGTLPPPADFELAQ